ncbi:MAG: radical SAM protein [Candidatus Hermodarchaeota archaeon]
MYKDLENCKLCAWECGVDRLAGEQGVCQMGIPEVASCQLHPAPPASYTIFTAGCNFKCLNCQNWGIAHYPSNSRSVEGIIAPDVIAQIGVNAIRSIEGQAIGADRLFFSGGSPTVSLPWIQEVISHAKNLNPEIKVNFDTNGFPSKLSFQRILSFSDSITFDIKAYNDEVHRMLTGAPVEPVLRNAEEMAKHSDRLWEFRILVIPEIVDLPEIQAIAEFLVSLDQTLPVCFLAFRPNFCLDRYPGATVELMRVAVERAQRLGLENVSWAGFTDIPGSISSLPTEFQKHFAHKGAAVAAFYAQEAGCKKIHRNCGECDHKASCKLKTYKPSRNT